MTILFAKRFLPVYPVASLPPFDIQIKQFTFQDSAYRSESLRKLKLHAAVSLA
jgi:hypothetical protein